MNIDNKKIETAKRLAGIVRPVSKDGVTSKHFQVKEAQLKNLISAMSRYVSEESWYSVLVTVTFGQDRIDIRKMSDTQIIKVAEMQHDSLIAMLFKIRRNKKIKPVRYLAVTEVQSDGNLHIHIRFSVETVEKLIALIEAVFNFKRRYPSSYQHRGKSVFSVGRTHIGISNIHRQALEERYELVERKDKKDPNRYQYEIKELESRQFRGGHWTPLEFYTANMMKERYEEKIENYLVKTLLNTYKLPDRTIKEGAAKVQFNHDAKTLFDDSYVTEIQKAFIRLVGNKVYTHSKMPFPFKLYQKFRKKLIAHDKDYRLFHHAIKEIQEGNIVIKNGVIYLASGDFIARDDV